MPPCSAASSAGFIVQCIIISIIKETADIGKRPVDELLPYLVIPFRIFLLKAHADRHRYIRHGQSQCHHHPVILEIAHGPDTTHLANIAAALIPYLSNPCRAEQSDSAEKSSSLCSSFNSQRILDRYSSVKSLWMS